MFHLYVTDYSSEILESYDNFEDALEKANIYNNLCAQYITIENDEGQTLVEYLN